MTETIWSWLMKLNRLNVEKCKNYSSKFELQIHKYVDFKADFKDVNLRCFSDFRFFSLGLCQGTLPANLEEHR